jgi:RNA polymerase sigma factor (sigma-70 family)
MQELDDISLLREYVDHGSEDAFAALVTRHVNKVYSIALRHTRNSHQAEEIAQAVFVILARQARQLGSRVIISGWLCRTAQLTAVTHVRSETRRTRREQEAYMQNPLVEPESDVWPQIEPLLDAAMAGLSEIDHHAVVLRFFDGKSMREVGAALGASEDAAKMRVNRAVEKLRRFFTKRGIVVSAAVLTAAISANSVQCAPATLVRAAATVALAKGATASTPTLTLIKEVLKIMAWTKAKTAIAVAAVTLLVGGTANLVVKSISHPNSASANPLKVQSLGAIQRDTGPDRGTGPHGAGPDPLLLQHNPNARFANLTPEQRVEQARQHYPESVEALRK